MTDDELSIRRYRRVAEGYERSAQHTVSLRMCTIGPLALRPGDARRFPDSLLLTYPKSGHSLERDFEWLGNHRYGIIHMQGDDAAHLRRRAEEASEIVGWTPPFADGLDDADPLADTATCATLIRGA